jgi:hypothetical protein
MRRCGWRHGAFAALCGLALWGLELGGLALGGSVSVASAQESSDAGDTLGYPQRESIPAWALDRLAEGKLASGYRVSTALNPFYLSGDLDGDGREDVAILVRQIASGKLGIAVLRAGSTAAEVLGAGVEVGNGGDDFGWMDFWRVEPKGSVEKGGEGSAPRAADALLVGKTESASALLVWDGKRFRWRQEGD